MPTLDRVRQKNLLFGDLQEDRQFLRLSNDKIYERFYDRIFADKNPISQLRWAGHLIRVVGDDPAWKAYKGNIYGRKRR